MSDASIFGECLEWGSNVVQGFYIYILDVLHMDHGAMYTMYSVKPEWSHINQVDLDIMIEELNIILNIKPM